MTSVNDAGEFWVLGLGNAKLTLSEPREMKGPQDADGMPFTVIASAELGLLAPGSHAYRGRAHSLWYCDLEEEDRFAWYELAFMNNPMLAHSTGVAPFAQSPAEGAVAILPGIGTRQLAWTPTKLVPGDLDEFIARWGQWMGNAYRGPWSHPSRLPEHQVLHNWRGV
jgi:serine/threonine-protein kinase